jgi:hypothetical protein
MPGSLLFAGALVLPIALVTLLSRSQLISLQQSTLIFAAMVFTGLVVLALAWTRRKRVAETRPGGQVF